MKKILIVFCLFSYLANSQVSSYNKGIKKTSLEFGKWFLNQGIETNCTKQNPVGYKTSYDELKKVLSFYNLNIVESEVDESLIDKSVESLNDFKNMSDSLLIEWSKLNMVWRTAEGFQINWMCDNEMNLILIQKIKK
jgi:hypothetical protein